MKSDRMKMKNKTNRTAPALALGIVLIFAALVLGGCGYSVVSKKAIGLESVKMGRLENATTEPGLEIVLIEALADELMKQGITVKGDSAHEIYGSINAFELKGVAEKDRLFTSYEVIIKGSFFLRGPDGKALALRGQNPFIVTFASHEELNLVFARRQEAVRRAMRELSSEIVSGIVYR